MSTWIFQGNPDYFEIEGYLAASSGLVTWRVRRYANQIKPADTVYLWRAGGEGVAAGIIAEGTITEAPRLQIDDPAAALFWKRPPEHPELTRVKIRLNRIASHKEVLKHCSHACVCDLPHAAADRSDRGFKRCES